VRGEHVDARSDVFSFGSILYEMLARRKPFDGDSVHSVLYKVMKVEPTPLETLCPDLPPVLHSLVARAMARSAAERFADGTELRDSLAAARRSIVGGEPGESLAGTGPGVPDAARPRPAPSRPAGVASDRAAAAPASWRPGRPVTQWLVAFLVATAALAAVAVAHRSHSPSSAARPPGQSSSPSEIDGLTRALVEGQVELARRRLAAGDPAEAARHAQRALQFDGSNSPAIEALRAARQATDRLAGAALADARTALARGDTAGAAAAFWRLLQADADNAAAEALVPALDRALESEARTARGMMEDARRAAESAAGGHAEGHDEGAALARDGEAALSAGRRAAAARAFMRARDRFRRALP
jgi:hypothetical protein